MRIDLQAAYVLHTRPFRDTSLLVDCLTKDYGRISLIAKGSRSAKSRQRQLIQPFSPLTISWLGKGELKTLVSLEPSAQSFNLSNHFLYSGFYANELLTYLLAHGDPATRIFILYENLLCRLHDHLDLEKSLRIFEFSLLDELGYGIDFESEATRGEKIDDDVSYFFRSEIGFFLESEESCPCFKGRYINAIAQGDFSDKNTKKCAKEISRLALSHHLQGKKIKSRELFY